MNSTLRTLAARIGLIAVVMGAMASCAGIRPELDRRLAMLSSAPDRAAETRAISDLKLWLAQHRMIYSVSFTDLQTGTIYNNLTIHPLPTQVRVHMRFYPNSRKPADFIPFEFTPKDSARLYDLMRE